MRRLFVVLALLLAACGGKDSSAAQVDDTENLVENKVAFDPTELEARVTELESQVETLQGAMSAAEGSLEEVLASFEALEIPEVPDMSHIDRQLRSLKSCMDSILWWIRNGQDRDRVLIC